MPTPMTWQGESERLHMEHCSGCSEYGGHSCSHEMAVPYDESACFGYCRCGEENIPNNWRHHYPCTHPAPDVLGCGTVCRQCDLEAEAEEATWD